MNKNSRKGQPIRKWTQEEEERLIANVRNHVLCLSKAFEITSKEIQRSPKAISAHWYTYTSKQHGRYDFGLISKDYIVRNRKNAKPGKAAKMPKGIFAKILNLLGFSY